METLPATINRSPELTEVEFTEGLPLALVSVLERRYLSTFNADDWIVSTDSGDVARPLLRDVIALGRPPAGAHGWSEAMPSVLAACNEPGHALITVLHARDGLHRLYLGARRIIGAGAYSTEDHLAAQESAFKAHVTGLDLGPVRRLANAEMPDLASFLESAPWLGVLTGVPSRRAGAITQSIDRVVSAVGAANYAIMIVAEPMSALEIETALDACRRLKSEIHSYARLTMQRSKGGSKGESEKDPSENGTWKTQLPAALYMLMGFSSLLPGGQVIRGVAQGVAMAGAYVSARGTAAGSKQLTTTESWSQSGGFELLDANAQACETILDRHIESLQRARAGGWWRTAVYVAAESEAALRAVSGALRSLMAGDGSEIDPIRMITPPHHLIRENLLHGRLAHILPARGTQGHPLGSAYDALATCLNSDELSVLISPPQNEIPGIPMRTRSTFALTSPPDEGTIGLGHIEDGSGNLHAPLRLTTAELNRHVLITGVPGSGKSNTCMCILREAWRTEGIPFLVIEPVKREYRALASLPELRGRLRVYAAGSRQGTPLRLNPLVPVPGIPIGRHIDMLKAVFNASFPMHAGMPYVLEEALIDIYVERGWSLTDVTNRHLSDSADIDARSALMPDLQDLHDKIDQVLSRKHYAQEIQLNLGAALRSRLNSLMVGNKGVLLNTRRSTPAYDLFGAPTVIELQDLSDEHEKAFVMALLLVLLYQYAEMRQGNDPDRYDQLQHLTLVEEAHRLLSASNGAQASEVGDARGKAVSMFTDMLAEMRAYGEGFLIADQVATLLAPQVVKNTSLKIIHRLTAPDDRQLCGSCTNLNDEQTRSLNNLRTGQAVVHDERIGEAILLRVPSAKPPMYADGLSNQLHAMSDSAFVRLLLQRNAGCRSCPAPCEVYPLLREQRALERVDELTPFLDALLLCDGFEPWPLWTRWLDSWRVSSFSFAKGGDVSASAYCAVTQMAYVWIGTMLSARRGASLTPADRFDREKAARAVGDLVRAWLAARELDANAQSVLHEARRAIRAVLTSAPPLERDGCAGCPARCQMLVYVSPNLVAIRKQLALGGAASSRNTAAVERLLAPVWEKVRSSGVDESRHRHWTYCAVTNLDVPENATLLDDLRGTLSGSEGDELRGFFGGGGQRDRE